MKKIRVMIFNVAYLTGVNGSFLEYILKAHRFVIPKRKVQEKLSMELTNLVKGISPDILFLAEIKNRPYITSIKKLFRYGQIDSKYKQGSWFSLLPFFQGNCNGIFLKEKFLVKKIFLSNGTKKLLYKVSIDAGKGLDIFFIHSSRRRGSRKRQLLEIVNSRKKNRNIIISGDLNILGGRKELKKLLGETHLNLAGKKNENTFPRENPSKPLDLFLFSGSVRIEVSVLKNITISDHLPVFADITIEK